MILFLDIDGVLNRHEPHSNGFCGIEPENARHLNRILLECPETRIVVSSAWRYYVHNGHMTVRGLEGLLLTHGLDCRGRVLDVTDPDPDTFNPAEHEPPFDAERWAARGLIWRKAQISNWLLQFHDYKSPFVVLDDLDLDMPELVRTDPRMGLTARLARAVVARLRASDLSGALEHK